MDALLELRTGLAVTNFVKLLFDDFYFGICPKLVFESAGIWFLFSSYVPCNLREAPVPAKVELADCADVLW